MNSSNFIKGDILFATHRKIKRGYHPIIYLEPLRYSSKEFIGAMITHSDSNGNIALSDNHFLDTDDNGNFYHLTYENSFLVPAKLIKFEKWGPFTKVGQLSEEGIEFVENLIGHFQEETFSNYFRRMRN